MIVQTEIGLLPEDWEVVRLEDQFKTFATASFSRDQMSDQGEVMCIHYGDIHTKYGNIVDANKDEIPFVSTSQAAKYKLLKDGDILLADASEDDEGIGKPIAVICHDKKIIAGLHILPLRPKNDECWDVRFPSYLFSGRMVKGQVEKLSEGTKVNSITYNKIKDVLVPLPKDKTEQQNIATALSSIDKLIDDLGRTIQKKQRIREGAMEELLSGKKRLPGFTEEWVEVKFEEIYRFAKEGGTPSTSVAEFYKDANIPFAKIEDLSEHYLTKTSSYISELGLQNSSAWLVPVNSLLLSNGATLGEVTITAIPTATKQGILGLVIREQFSLEYLYYVLKAKTFQRAMEAITTHGTMDCAYLKDLKGIPLYIPSDIHEQHAIADILTSMDDEISLLESERAKYEQIRSGMMEELLTGKKRLIKK